MIRPTPGVVVAVVVCDVVADVVREVVAVVVCDEVTVVVPVVVVVVVPVVVGDVCPQRAKEPPATKFTMASSKRDSAAAQSLPSLSSPPIVHPKSVEVA